MPVAGTRSPPATFRSAFGWLPRTDNVTLRVATLGTPRASTERIKSIQNPIHSVDSRRRRRPQPVAVARRQRSSLCLRTPASTCNLIAGESRKTSALPLLTTDDGEQPACRCTANPPEFHRICTTSGPTSPAGGCARRRLRTLYGAAVAQPPLAIAGSAAGSPCDTDQLRKAPVYG